MTQCTEAQNSIGRKYLTFSLGAEEYGISISRIKEIIGIVPVTPIPQAPVHVRGVINLRGTILPIIDLRLRFQLTERAYNDQTCVIVVEGASDQKTGSTGIVVDSVSEVITVRAEDIAEVPFMGTTAEESCVLGMAKIQGGVKMLLDIDRVLSGMDAEYVQAAA